MKTYFVDSFTSERFKGNPAAVCITEQDIPVQMMQSIAMEIGFSETAFIKHLSENKYSIRFYTPKTEIALCGHATLAASKIIFETSSLQNIEFINVENTVLNISKADGSIAMVFPVYETDPIDVPTAVFLALGLDAAIDTRYSQKNRIILINMEGTEKLAALNPDFNALLKSYDGINGILVTAKSFDNKYDFHYRYFWPWAGTNEDPVTGGVQTFLTKYWADRTGKTSFNAFQSSLRTGSMRTQLQGDKVTISGDAVITFEGDFKADF